MPMLTAEDFESYVGQAFVPQGQDRALTLVSVTRYPGFGHDSAVRDPFALILRGPPGNTLPEGMYGAVAEDGRVFPLYIIPIHTAARTWQDYQAMFN